MLYIISLLHARIYTSTVSHGKLFFIPCHGTSAACGSSKQASRTARPDSLMILSIRDNLRLIHWGRGKWCQKGLEKNNQTLDWFLKMSHQKTTSSWPNAAFFYFLNIISTDCHNLSLFRNFFQTMFVQSQLQSTTKGTVQRVGKSVPIRNSAAKLKTTYSGIPPYLAVRVRHVEKNLMTFPCWQSFILICGVRRNILYNRNLKSSKSIQISCSSLHLSYLHGSISSSWGQSARHTLVISAFFTLAAKAPSTHSAGSSNANPGLSKFRSCKAPYNCLPFNAQRIFFRGSFLWKVESENLKKSTTVTIFFHIFPKSLQFKK